jgi:hypothetical protein
MQQNSDESGKPLLNIYITVISFSSKDLYFRVVGRCSGGLLSSEVQVGA